MTKDYSQPYDRLRDDCPVKAAIDVVRGRWKPSILFELSGGTKRFGDLQSAPTTTNTRTTGPSGLWPKPNRKWTHW